MPFLMRKMLKTGVVMIKKTAYVQDATETPIPVGTEMEVHDIDISPEPENYTRYAAIAMGTRRIIGHFHHNKQKAGK